MIITHVEVMNQSCLQKIHKSFTMTMRKAEFSEIWNAIKIQCVTC